MEPIKLRLLISLDSINDLSVVIPPLINETDNKEKDIINAKGIIKKHQLFIDDMTTHLAKTESFLNSWSDHINKSSAATKGAETEQFTTFKTLHTVDTIYLNGYKQLRLWKSKLIEVETLHESWTMEFQSTDEARARVGRVGLSPPPPVNVQLPKLILAKFDGKSNFHEWWDSFKIAINDNQQLPKIQKMIHLKSFYWLICEILNPFDEGQTVICWKEVHKISYIFLRFSYEISVEICVIIMNPESEFNTTTTFQITLCLFSDSRLRALQQVDRLSEDSRSRDRLLAPESARF